MLLNAVVAAIAITTNAVDSASNAVAATTNAVAAAAETNVFCTSTGKIELMFDASLAPDLMDWTKTEFAPAIKKWTVKLEDIMASDGWTPPESILFTFVNERLSHSPDAPAWATTRKNRVSLRADWFRENLGGESLGATIHELVHIMQGYWNTPGRNKTNCPKWASEGYADYIRWFLFEPESDGSWMVRKNPDRYHYNDSYRVTAHFFDFVERKHPGTMKKLNAALRDRSFRDNTFWKDATGSTAQELEEAWRADTKATAREVDARMRAQKAARKAAGSRKAAGNEKK